MLTRPQKLVVLLILVAPVVAMLIWMGLYVSSQLNRLKAHLASITVYELERRFGKEVRVGKITVTSIGTAVIENIQIAEGRTFAKGTLASAEKVEVRFSLGGLLSGRGAGAVSSVAVISPRVNLVRRPNGTFNISELLRRPPGPPGPPFTGTVDVTGGVVIYRDYLAGISGRPVMIHLRDVNGRIDAARAPEYRFRVAVTGTKSEIVSARAVGFYNAKSKIAILDVNGRGVNAKLARVFVSLPRGLDVRAGILHPILGIRVQRTDNRWITSATGVVSVVNATVAVNGIRVPVTGVRGNIMLTKDQVAVTLLGLFAQTPIRMVGRISDFQRPKLDLVVSSQAARFAQLVQSVESLRVLSSVVFFGTGPLWMHVSGTMTAPRVVVTASIPRAKFRGYEAAQIEITAEYRDNVVSIESLRMRVAGGMIAAFGTVTMRGVPVVRIRGRAVGVDAARLRLPIREPISGMVDAQFTIAGTILQPEVFATATIRRGVVRGVVLSASSLRVIYRQGRVEATGQLVVRVADGVVRLSGRFTPSTIDARYIAEGLNLALLKRFIGLQELSGVLYSTGRVSGSIGNPTINGVAEVFRGRYKNIATDYVKATFSGNMDSVTISEAVIRVFPAELKMSGTIANLQTPRIDFKGELHVRHLRVEQLMAVLGRSADVIGILAGDFTISGVYLRQPPPGVSPLVDAVASGTLQLEDGAAFGYPVEAATAALTFRDGVFVLSETTISSQGAELTIGGSVSTTTHLVDLDFTIANFDLARVREKLEKYVALGGVVNANGTVTGPWDDILLVLNTRVDNPTLNNTRFDRGAVNLAYSDNTLTELEAQLVRGDQSYTLHATDFDLATRCLASGTININSASIRDLWSTMAASPYVNSDETLKNLVKRLPQVKGGRLNGSLTITGCLADQEGALRLPNGMLRLVAQDVGLNSQKIDSIVLSASATDGAISIAEFRAVSGDMYVEATPAEPNAPVYENGRLGIELAAYNVDLSRLSPWLGENTPSGVMTARFDIVGPTKEPSVIGSVEVVDPGYRGLVFDRLRASRIEIVGNSIKIADIILATDGHQIVARGSLPWSWSEFAVPDDQPLQLTAELEREDLSLLAVFIPLIDADVTKGPVQAVMEADGTISDLRLSGALQIRDGTIGVKGFKNTFENVNADLVFDGKQVLINRLSAQSSLGGTVEVVPGGFITTGALDGSNLNLLVAARGLKISETNVLGYRENVTATIDADLSVTGNLRSPLVADKPIDSLPGGITIRDADLVFAVPETPPTPAPKEFAVNPQFEVRVGVGPNVTIKPPKMTLAVDGGGLVTGTLNRPNAKLDLRVTRGFLMLGTSVLRVAPGGMIELAYVPPAAPSLVLRDFQATTMVTATSPTGRRERYQVTLQVSGPVDRMQINLTSSPPGLTREQMLAALGHVEGLFETAEGTLQQELTNVLTAVGTGALFAPVEQLFIERLGFEQFTLEYGAATPLALFLSRHLFDSVYVSFYQRLSGGLASSDYVIYQLQLSYRFRRLYQFSFGVDDQQTSTIEAGYHTAF